VRGASFQIWTRSIRATEGLAGGSLEGSDNLHVLLIQAMLHTLGEIYPNLGGCGLTGVCDGPTVCAVKSLQRCCGMPESGILDKRLWQLLAGLYHQAVGDGDRKNHCG
jgi:hypothetical protein